MVLSDSFTTAIFKQSFQKMFEKDAEGHLKMGFNGTLAVQVRTAIYGCSNAYVSSISNPCSLSIDNQGAQDLRTDWSCSVSQQEHCFGRRDRYRYWKNLSLEDVRCDTKDDKRHLL